MHRHGGQGAAVRRIAERPAHLRPHPPAARCWAEAAHRCRPLAAALGEQAAGAAGGQERWRRQGPAGRRRQAQPRSAARPATRARVERKSAVGGMVSTRGRALGESRRMRDPTRWENWIASSAGALASGVHMHPHPIQPQAEQALARGGAIEHQIEEKGRRASPRQGPARIAAPANTKGATRRSDQQAAVGVHHEIARPLADGVALPRASSSSASMRSASKPSISRTRYGARALDPDGVGIDGGMAPAPAAATPCAHRRRSRAAPRSSEMVAGGPLRAADAPRSGRRASWTLTTASAMPTAARATSSTWSSSGRPRTGTRAWGCGR